MYLKSKLPHADPQTAPRPAWDTLEALAAWLETKNPDETYPFWNNLGCLFAQYGQSVGLTRRNAWIIASDAIFDRLGLGFWRRSFMFDRIAARHPRTFSAALARCRAEIARRSAQP